MTLADKIEAAEGPSRELFQAAFEVILPAQDSKQWLEVASRFVGFLRAEAWLSAAEMLVPEGSEWELTTLYGVARAAVDLNGDEGPSYGSNECGSPALALCAAALRARAGEG